MRNSSRHQGFEGQVWDVHKFGGSSLADSECFRKVATIVEEQLGISSDNNADSGPQAYSTDVNFAVVVSAIGGKPKVTDLLLNSVSAAAERDEGKVDAALDLILAKHHHCIDDLFTSTEADRNDTVESLKKSIAKDISDIRDILKTVSLMKWQATRISELVSGYGECWSALILSEFMALRSLNRFQSLAQGDDSNSNNNPYHHFILLDARRVITIDEDAIKDGAVCWDLSLQKLKREYQIEARDALQKGTNDVIHFIVTGYICSNTQGVASTLQRDGSDYSAAIMGRLLESASITIWTDVDGVLSADPRRVPDSYVLPEVSFNEAMELAYFGAKVIHPKTMQPAIMGDPQIPIYIRNTFNSSFKGSRIFTSSTTHADRDRCVCGFSTIEKMAIVNVEGSGMVGVKGVARRLFGTLEGIGVNVVLIAQASSEHSITFATTMQQAKDAKHAIEEEFHKEIKQSHISAIEVVAPCSIIAAVGDGMHLSTGVSGRFFTALGDAKINILAISQGSNERNISAVILEAESTRALRAVHAAFRLSHTNVRLSIVGMNEIGNSLLKLLETQREKLLKVFDIDLQVCAILKEPGSIETVVLKGSGEGHDSITSSAYDFATGGSFLLGASAKSVSFEKPLEEVAIMKSGGLESFGEYAFSEDSPVSIIFDCTADETAGEKHVEWLKGGINVVTANNSALSGGWKIRNSIKEIEKMKKAKYMREVTVGGGLPIISTLRDLLASGDRVRRIDGILSVSMSYIMHRIAPPPGENHCFDFDQSITMGAYTGDTSMTPTNKPSGKCSFSDAVKEAIALGLTEEDPIKDLSNEYTARCLMVLARELGFDDDYDVQKIQLLSESLISDKVQHYSDVESKLNAEMKKRVETAAANGCVPRHIASVDVKTGGISINIVDVPQNHVFAITPPSNECVRFFTQRHKTRPLIIEGPSAGADSTASALLAEVLNLMRAKTGSKSGILSRTPSSAFLG